MAYCPSCRSEFREGFSRCQACDEALVDHLPGLDLEGVEAVEQAVARGEAIVVARGSLQDVRRMQAELAEFRVPAVVFGDEKNCATGSCQQVYDVMVHPTGIEAAQNALAANYMAMLVNEGVDPAAADATVELAEGQAIVCPACETSFVAGGAADTECPECGLFLGVPEA